jgi:predicted HicB family RNase H-like nuclease
MDKETKNKFASVCAAIRKDANLQFFFQEIFNISGLFAAAPGASDLRDRFEGQRDLALIIKQNLEDHDPTLFAELYLNWCQQTTNEPQKDLEDGA